MDNTILYDFQAALKTIIDAHTDMKLVITKWRELLDSTPKDVVFTFADGSTVTVPNIQKVVDTINTRSLPPDPSFNSVKAVGRGGDGTFTNTSLTFSGTGDRGATYGVLGVSGNAWNVEADVESLTDWPLCRYWVHAGDASHNAITVNLSINPNIPRGSSYKMSDFFVMLPDSSKTLKIVGVHPAGRPYASNVELSGPGMWHIVASIRKPEAGSASLTLYAKKVG